MTLMRLTCNFDLDTENRLRMFNRILAENPGWASGWRRVKVADPQSNPFAVLQAGYITGYTEESAVSTKPQKRALSRYRERLVQRGMARFEVLGRDADRQLSRSLARQLAGEGPDSARLRAAVCLAIAGERAQTGGILDVLRRSPLVGADLDLSRPLTSGRKVDL